MNQPQHDPPPEPQSYTAESTDPFGQHSIVVVAVAARCTDGRVAVELTAASPIFSRLPGVRSMVVSMPEARHLLMGLATVIR